jgi:deoxycytidylate deaminase
MTKYLDQIGKERVRELLYQAYEVAQHSPDPSSQNGALLYHVPTDQVVATACNTFPEGIKHTEERWNDRDYKYPLVTHAEAGVLFSAFRNGVFDMHNIADIAMICPWAACSGCTGVMLGFGLTNVIAHKQGMCYTHGPWVKDVDIAIKIMMPEATPQVTYELYDGPVGGITVRRDGKLFNPNETTPVAGGS